MPEPETLQVTTRSAWKGAQKEGQLITLPSGNVIRVVRTMDLMHLLKAGKIPNPLSGIVQGMVDRGSTELDASEMDMDTIKSTMQFVDQTVLKVVVEPKLAAPPEPNMDDDGNRLADLAADENETDEDYAKRIAAWEPKDPEAVPLTWLDMDDRMFIFVFAQGFAADLAAFREEPAKAVAPVADVPKRPKPTKRTGGRK